MARKIVTADFGKPGYELNLLYLTGLAALALGGPGALSPDAWLALRKQRCAPRPPAPRAFKG